MSFYLPVLNFPKRKKATKKYTGVKYGGQCLIQLCVITFLWHKYVKIELWLNMVKIKKLRLTRIQCKGLNWRRSSKKLEAMPIRACGLGVVENHLIGSSRVRSWEGFAALLWRKKAYSAFTFHTKICARC